MVSWWVVFLRVVCNEYCVLVVAPAMVGNARYTCLSMVVWLLSYTLVVHNDYCSCYAFV